MEVPYIIFTITNRETSKLLQANLKSLSIPSSKLLTADHQQDLKFDCKTHPHTHSK